MSSLSGSRPRRALRHRGRAVPALADAPGPHAPALRPVRHSVRHGRLFFPAGPRPRLERLKTLGRPPWAVNTAGGAAPGAPARPQPPAHHAAGALPTAHIMLLSLSALVVLTAAVLVALT
jgi:hypothetical protein